MGTAVIEIRPMESGDLSGVVTLEQANQPKPWSERVFRDELIAENRIYLIALDGDVVAGFCGVMIVGEEAHVTNLLVAPSYRRHGLGRDLMVALADRAVADGARHLTLEVRSSNEAARSLYAGLGLAPVGVRPGYYGDEDALILWVHDIDRPEYLEALR